MPPESESPLPSLTAARVVVVAGKGGVGKTTVTAAIARAAAMTGARVLVVELDGKPALDRLLPERPGQRLEVMHLAAPEALEEYLHEHGFRRIAKRLNRSGVIDMVGTAAPGIDDVVLLGKIKQLERSGAYDLIVVDGPAAGHAVTFLTSASALSEAARGGPVKAQADDVLELLGDPDRCATVLVTLAETTPVNETVETAFALEERVGVGLGPIVVNAVDEGVELPEEPVLEAALAELEGSGALGRDAAEALRGAAAFRRSRRATESEALTLLSERLPLPQVHVPAIAVAGLDDRHVDQLAVRLVGSPAHPGTAGDAVTAREGAG